MLKFNHILFPIDFSERCFSAVPFVESLASRYRARITLLSVVQPFYYSAMGDPAGESVLVDTEELLRSLTAELDNALTQKFMGLSVTRVAELGDPAQVIADFACFHSVDLIMMPTHGYGPFRRLLLGSVTARVLHDAKCAVWTAAHIAEPPCHDHVVCRNILCAVDGTPTSVSLLKRASDFSADAGAALRVLHVIPGMEGSLSRQIDAEFEAEMRNEAFRTIEQLQVSAGVKAPMSIAAGNVADGVREAALQYGADLVVIGRAVLEEKFGRLRTHAHGIIRQSPCPVLSV
jgi:nucleotide-binding universal stress UspA family protein